ncbi:Alpha-glucuronidase [Anaerohalosphaera lusitana]|uniref:Alpha-glucuronidase n=1 Tax=Anaerohalosphaera lusitana TaxID=1936003 RepID=A0A1U9NIH7_9BACT|nr:malectin domain-containing carbohydrate-binding protein [Anaerohalosphaera lusitana]AQT67390.1 Alpha-glucuronidase [Anaerohalosphaera lusitana]
MTGRTTAKSLLILFCILSILTSAVADDKPAKTGPALICYPSGADLKQQLAAKEIRRYIYLRTDELLKLKTVKSIPGDNDLIVIATKDSNLLDKISFDKAAKLKPQDYAIKTLTADDRKIVLICGGDPLGALYGAYNFIEHFGVRFNIHGDTIPDEKIDFYLPDIDKTASPLFELRGILPFHDFPEGPDWWNADDYKFYISQMVKMKMNFIGLHCYPNVPWGPEPTVWMGLPEDVNPDGTVRASYPASYHTTERLNGYGEDSGSPKRWWGYSAAQTSDFSAGTSRLFETDNFGPDCMAGHVYRNLTPETSNEVFNRTGKMFDDVFSYAQQLGVKTAIGTETPLHIPDKLKERLRQKGMDPDAPATMRKIYEGMMTRISHAHPLDYYWAWTSEGWLNPVDQPVVDKTISEFGMMSKAIKKLDEPFNFATCGWAMGPAQNPTLFDRSLAKDVPISSITSWLGASRLNDGFAKIENRPKWAIPWLEDDTAMLSPQLWVGRLRRDAADARDYGCTGLMGIHWRTRILSPNFTTLADAGWRQDWLPEEEPVVPTEKIELKEGHSGGQAANYAPNEITGTDADPVYQTCRYNLSYYRLLVPNGKYNVTLKFCEVHYREPGKRVFNVSVMGEKVAENLDVFKKAGHLGTYDLVVSDVKVTNGILDITFDPVVEFPFIAGIVIEGKTADLNQIEGKAYTRKINCGNGKWQDYQADLGKIRNPSAGPLTARDLPCEDFYRDWCKSEFGPEAARELAAIFTELDSGGPLEAYSFPSAWPRNIPLTNVWIAGPGGIRVDQTPWSEAQKDYAFVDKMSDLRTRIKGKGNLARFDYWLNSFKYLRAMGELSCTRGELDKAVNSAANENDKTEQKTLAAQRVLPIRIKLARLWEQMMTYQLAATYTPGELGTIANLEQHNSRNLNFVNLHDEKLEKLLGRPLPETANITGKYQGSPRIFVPALRSNINANERFELKVIILAKDKPQNPTVRWRPLGASDYNTLPLTHVARGVYKAKFPTMDKDFEYHIDAEFGSGENVRFPATAPAIDQSVVVLE